ncbi:MAG TPA: hypothetical protein VHF92_04875 [Geodermatophilus sp.]|nr:hypothetical protein [Geodermatophilus sp.]
MHVSAAAGLIGADLALLTLAASGVGGADPPAVYPAMSLVSTWVVAPLAVISLGTGVRLAVLGPYGLLRYWWVTIKLALTLTLTGLVLFVVVPGLDGAAASAVSGRSLPDARTVLYVAVFSVAVTVLALMVGLAVYKPRWRVPARSRR